jgi:Fe-S cluster biogenesis protein NfuA
MPSTNDIAIQMQLLYPWVCKFTSDKTLHDGFAAYFGSREQSKDSPLAEALFTIEYVTELVIARHNVTVSVVPGSEWNLLLETIARILGKHVESGKSAVRTDFHKGLPSHQEIMAVVTDLLETEINPYIAGHGGYIRVVDVQENNVYLQMEGGCQGCASYAFTLKFGVERAIRSILPLVGEILDETDHKAGVNPYYPGIGQGKG